MLVAQPVLGISENSIATESTQCKDLIPNLVAGLTTAMADIPDAMSSAV